MYIRAGIYNGEGRALLFFAVFPNKIDSRMYLHKSDKLALIRILSGGPPSSSGSSPTLTLLNVFVRYRESAGEGGAKCKRVSVVGLGQEEDRWREGEREGESPRNDRFEVNEEGRDSARAGHAGRGKRGHDRRENEETEGVSLCVVAVDNGGDDRVNDNGSPRDIAREPEGSGLSP